MKTLWYVLLLTIFTSSCIKKGEESLSGSGKIEDITINLLKISPANTVIAPLTTAQFSAVGGNPPYTFSMDSGLGSIDSDGLYTAPASTGNFTVKVTDLSGNTAFGLVVVGSALQISPSSQTMGTSQTLNFSAIGGVAPFTYSIISGLGTINSSTGEFTSDPTTGLVTVEVRDQNNDTAFASITVVDALTLTPGNLTVENNSVTAFSAAGGTPPYTYSVYAGSGSIDVAGNYTAPASESNDIVRVTDNDGNYAETLVSVKFGPNAAITRTNLPPNTNATVSSSTGTAPFTYSIISGNGSVVAGTGVFTSPAQASTTIIRVTDNNGFVDDVVATTFNLKKMTMADQHTCYSQLQADNVTTETKCWGRMNQGAVQAGKAYVGDEAGEMGANLSTVSLGTGLVPNGLWMGIYYHTCVSFTNNTIKCFGHGSEGKLGLGNQNYYGHVSDTMGDDLNTINLAASINTTVPVENRVAMGSQHTCVLTASGSAKCFGQGNYGQLGNGSTADRCTAGSNCGTNNPELSLTGGKSITKIAAGHYSTCAIIAPDNRVKCWGENNYGQLGQGNTTDLRVVPSAVPFIDLGTGVTVKDISAGFFHACAILNDDTIKCWGRNNYGQLGQGNNATQGDGGGEMGNALAIADMGTVSFPVKIYSSGYKNCAIFNNGGVKCWGYNGYGQLGLGNSAHRGDGAGEMGDNLPFVDLGTGRTATHLSLAERNTCATLDNGTIKCWGDNSFGQLGQGNTVRIGDNSGEMGDSLAAIDINGTSTMSANSRYATCVLTTANEVKCFGLDDNGNTGINDGGYGDNTGETVASMAQVDLGAGVNVTSMASGRYNTCFITDGNEVKCIGYNNSGSLGVGTTTNVGLRASQMGAAMTVTDMGTGLFATKVAMGENHSCAILNSGDLKCWGDGNTGATGYDSQTDRGDGAGEMGDNRPIVALGQTVKDVALTRLSTCAVLNDDTLKCWGYNNYGQLGVGNTTNRAYHTGANALNNYGLTDMGTGRTVKQISAGYNHFCALLDNDTVKCWGRDYAGQLGLETNNNHRGNGAGEMGDNLPVVDLGTGLTPVKIDSGIYHNCALFSNGKVKCWGYNAQGQLGVGDTAHRGDAVGEMGDNLPFVILPTDDVIVDIEVQGYSTCVLTDKNEMKCFGHNAYGQLGQQHRYNVGTDALSMGDNLPEVQ